MLNKSNGAYGLNKLFIREFPEYSNEFGQLLAHKDFVEMLEEIESCKLALLNINIEDEAAELYRRLIIELKQEILSFISRHHGNNNHK